MSPKAPRRFTKTLVSSSRDERANGAQCNGPSGQNLLQSSLLTIEEFFLKKLTRTSAVFTETMKSRSSVPISCPQNRPKVSLVIFGVSVRNSRIMGSWRCGCTVVQTHPSLIFWDSPLSELNMKRLPVRFLTYAYLCYHWIEQCPFRTGL